MKKYLFVLIICCFTKYGNSQNIGLGADAMYNFQTESFGAGARVSFFPNRRISIVPEFSYYFPFNKIQEYYLGLAIEFKFIYAKKFNAYLIAHGAYNSWLNHENSPMPNAEPNNWNGEIGIGISNNKCLRPFLEYRYNVNFRETHLRLGLLYIFGCDGRGTGGGKKRSTERCAAYPRYN